MTEYEQAVDLVARELWTLHGRLSYVGKWEYLTAKQRQKWVEDIKCLLALTWPSGQPMIGVISQDQRLRIPKVFVVDAQTANHMLTENFRRVLLPEEKR